MKKTNKILLSVVLIICIAAGAVGGTIMYTKKGSNDTDFSKGWCNHNNGYSKDGEEVKRLLAVTPSERQLLHNELEYYSFIHYGMNTFTEAEWGTGKEDPAQFNPEVVDTDQWVRVLKESGSKGVILTAKHHDGFCLFPSEYTEHSIKNSPYQDGNGDIVKQVKESCDKYDMKFGVYLSPWDMHEETYGTDEYNTFFINQLTELCTNYGELFAVWFDGARGKEAEVGNWDYDWDAIYETVRTYQPNANMCVCGPDVRWIGNEGGKVRESEWSVVAKRSSHPDLIAQESQQGKTDAKRLQKLADDDNDKGSREKLRLYSELQWYPAEADVSIHHDWFYNSKKQKRRSVKELTNIYFNTVGGNASLLLNVPPSKNGIIEKEDVKLLQDFKTSIDSVLKTKLDFNAEIGNENTSRPYNFTISDEQMFGDDDYIVTLKLNSPQIVNAVVLQEEIKFSQRVEAFDIYAKVNNKWKNVSSNTVIGSKKIVQLEKAKTTDEIKIVFTQSRSNPVIKNIELYSS